MEINMDLVFCICSWGEPHTVILHRGQKGFGFILRGAKSDSPLMELQPSDRFPALQYLDDVDVNGVADRAGLRKGDFILAVRTCFSIQLYMVLLQKEELSSFPFPTSSST